MLDPTVFSGGRTAIFFGFNMKNVISNCFDSAKPMLQKKCAYEYIALDLTSASTKSFALVDYYALSE